MRGSTIAAGAMVAVLLAVAGTAAGITVTSLGPMVQINTDGLPGAQVRDFTTIWDASNPMAGTILYCDSAASPYVIRRATTTDGGLTWTAGVDAGLDNPSLASSDERNPVVRDFQKNGNLVGLFGTKQGVYGSGFGANDVLFRATSSDGGESWSGEALVSFSSGAFPGHTGLNGFIEVFRTSTGILRGYTAMNNTNDGQPNPSGTHVVESSDGGATWTDVGNIQIPGPGGAFNVISANSPVFWFTDTQTDQERMGWFLFGEGSNNRGVSLLVSDDEGLSWTSAGFSFLDGTIRSGDAVFLSDDHVRLFYYRNTGSVPSDRQLWYEDFEITGMAGIVPNNVYVPEPGAAGLLAAAALALGGLATILRGKRR